MRCPTIATSAAIATTSGRCRGSIAGMVSWGRKKSSAVKAKTPQKPQFGRSTGGRYGAAASDSVPCSGGVTQSIRSRNSLRPPPRLNVSRSAIGYRHTRRPRPNANSPLTAAAFITTNA